VSISAADVEARAPRVHCGGQSLTHAQIRARAAKIASGLASLGISTGDRVALVMRNDVAYPQITLGAGLVGAIAVPVNWHWKGDEIKYVLEDSGAKVVFAHEDLAGPVESVLPTAVHLVEVGVGRHQASGEGRIALEHWLQTQPPWRGGRRAPPNSMIYTSGTTGRPKGVLREQATPQLTAERVRVVLEAFALEPGMRSLIPAPLYHTAPHIHMVFGLRVGVDLTIMPRFDAEELLRTVESERINHFQAVPTMFIRLLELPPEVRARYDISSLRAVVHAAAPCPPAVKHAIIEWLGPIVHEYYGGTETGIVVSCDSEQWLGHPGTVGKPVADADVKVFDDAGNELARGAVGHLYIKPPECQPAFTYHGQAAAAEALRRGGYVTIGDIGYLDEDGFVYITDRASDMVISGGVNIYPAEIEQCLQTLPGVHDSAVFGIPDREFGEALVAHVQLLPAAGITVEEVRAHLRASLAGYKVPRTIVFDPDLPRDDSGKLIKRRLRNRYVTNDHHRTGGSACARS
jgi:long-chain acyl-CoA synthetase